jgi:catechol 2,3-dioxygenase-like lactoylglutathione lyase family enzyme
MNETTRPIKALGEVVLRVRDIDTMQEFYEKVVGLELLARYESVMAFFRIAPDYEGHTQTLALFDQSGEADHRSRHYTGVDPEKSPLHHIAFTISRSDHQAEKERLQNLGLEVETVEHPWQHYRSLYITDPEGNVVEFVCYDASVR